MNTEDLLRRALSIAALAFATMQTASAQSPIQAQAPMILQVEGLTASKRDLIKQEIETQGDLRMRYACVPAGILILEAVPGRSVGDLRAQVAPIIRRHVTPGRSTELTITIQQAEDRCAQVR
jgi:hypothetical protein